MSARRRPRAALLALALTAALGGVATLTAPPVLAAPAAQADIPFEQFTLPNGLRVVVHTDRKAPIVAVNLWYHVGSKDEPAGRSGFAHLFEHLMFNGSENARGEYFTPFRQVGATNMNGTTWLDRTNYFQNVPTTALDMALWMESDRMGHLLGAIDQKTLDEQRGVVQNEKRQGENQPYGQADDVIQAALFPKGHPYHHSTIGSMNDLNAASLEDVKNWFRAWYGPNNAVLVLAGDIDVKTAKEKVAKYFGDIPAGPEMPRVQAGPVKGQPTRSTMTDKVPQARVYRAWSVAGYNDSDLERLQLLAQVLGGSKSSRLDQRLLFDDKLVDSVSVGIWPFELSSQFMITANVKAGVDPAKVEAAIDEELRRLLKDGPAADELERARTVFKAGFVRGIERIGGFGGKADTLAECAVYAGDPGCFREDLATLEAATPASVRDAGARWLGENGSHTLVVTPGERQALPEEPAATPAPLTLPPVDKKYSAGKSTVDRSKGVPMPERFPELKFPAQQRATLKNGTTVILAERHDVPVVQFNYQFNGGAAAAPADRPGIASFALSLLDEGAGDLDAIAFANRAESLGASLGAGAGQDASSASLSALKENLEPSLALFADMLRRPRFEQKDIERLRGQWIAGIRQEKAQPGSLAMRVLPGLVYGAGHPYAAPSSGTEASIAALTRDELIAYARTALRPQDATLVIVGDTTLDEIVPLLDRHFGDWTAEGNATAARTIPVPAKPAAPRVFLLDQPGAVQANIFAAQLVPSSKDPALTVFDMANTVLGGDFTARINMNLREEKHWSYGARSGAGGAVGPRLWTASAPVQIDKTAESIAELKREIEEYASGKRPATEEEIVRSRRGMTLSLPGAYETASAVASTIASNVLYGRPDDYVFKRKAEIEAITPAQASAAAKTLDPNALTWVVVGDLSKIEAPIRALNLGEVTVLDADGKVVRK